MRWAVAWTFVPDLDLTGVQVTKVKKDRKRTFGWSVEGGSHLPGSQQTAVDMLRKLVGWLEEIGAGVEVRREGKYVCKARLTAETRGWRGQRRRRREREKREEERRALTAKCEADGELAAAAPGYGKFSEVSLR